MLQMNLIRRKEFLAELYMELYREVYWGLNGELCEELRREVDWELWGELAREVHRPLGSQILTDFSHSKISRV